MTHEQSFPIEHSFAISRQARIWELTVTGFLWLWVMVSGYFWLTEQASWVPFLGAVLLAIFSLLNAYNTFTSRLIFTAEGIRYLAHGGVFVADWEHISFGQRRRLWRKVDVLLFSAPVPAKEKNRWGQLMRPLAISSVSLQPFGWPAAPLRAAISQFAPHILAG